MTLVIGLTGGIGSGKSTVSSMFSEFDIPVIDADTISHEVVEPGTPAHQEIISVFGEDILLDDNSLNRKKLGNIVFNDENKRTKLNHIVHPAVREEMLKQRDIYINRGIQNIVLDIPLLFESELTYLVDKIMVVYVDMQVQLDRLMARNHFSEQEALQRIHAQMPLKEKAEHADAVINNNGTQDNSFQQLKKLLNNWSVM